MATTLSNLCRSRVFLGGWAAALCGCLLVATVRAQSLDMEAAPPAPAAVASHQSGELDMDVVPTAPIPTKPAVQAVSKDNVQDGLTLPNPKAMPDPATTLTTTTAPATTTPTITPLATTTPSTTTPSATTPSIATSGTTTPGTTTPGMPAPDNGAPASTAAATPPPEPVSLDHPIVIDTARLKAGDTSVTLFGIEGAQGEAAQGLQAFLASTGNHVLCQAQTSADFVCLLTDGTDVAQAALINGAARTKADAPDAYRDQEIAAQAARRGIWANLPPPPVALKHPVVRDTATLVADNQTYMLNGVQGLGQPFAGQLQGYLAANGDSVTCDPQGLPDHFICVTSDNTDLAKVALVNGAAIVAPEAPDSYRLQQAEALNNHRGVWLNPPSNLLITSAAVAEPAEFALVVGDDGGDGVTYVGGVPTALIDGEAVFLVYGGDAGWGYYDHWHHWRGAPGRYRAHMEHFHPYGHGLRGYHDGVFRRDEPIRRDEVARRDDGLRREAAAHPGAERPGGVRVGEVRGAPAAGRPGEVRSAAAGAHPGMVQGGAHPAAAGGGFVHPGPSAAGFHPAAAAPHAAAPAVHASAGVGGGGGRKK